MLELLHVPRRKMRAIIQFWESSDSALCQSIHILDRPCRTEPWRRPFGMAGYGGRNVQDCELLSVRVRRP